MPAPFFSTVNGVNYVFWNPSAVESLSLPSGVYQNAIPITVGASPFAYTGVIDAPVLIGGGLITSIGIQGTYPPSGPYGFANPPSGTYLLNFSTSNTCAVPLRYGQTLVVAYTKQPQMYYLSTGLASNPVNPVNPLLTESGLIILTESGLEITT